MNKIDLPTFFLSVASAAFRGLGFSENGQMDGEINLELAKQNIDLLELMDEKTKGNRTSDEDQLIQQLLFQLRLKYVEIEKSKKA